MSVPAACASIEPLGELESHPESRVKNSQPHGIGRVAVLNDLVAWNNLGRNIVFADPSFRPRCIYDKTAFPDQDEASQFDLDMHAIVYLAESGLVLALNHLGILRAFRAAELRVPAANHRADPVAELRFVDDAECVVAAGERLVASRSHAGGGLWVSAQIDPEPRSGELPYVPALDSWDPVTALGTWTSASGEAWIALGAGQRVGIAPLRDGEVGQPRWSVEVPWQTAWLCWRPPLLWAAGSEPPAPGVGDYDWEMLRGGGFLALRLDDGRCVLQRAFGCDLAWGNGGVAVCMAGDAICGLDRRAALHVFRAHDGEPLGSTSPRADASLGIAHAAAVGGSVLAGFNRAGYRLFAYSVASAPAQDSGSRSPREA